MRKQGTLLFIPVRESTFTEGTATLPKAYENPASISIYIFSMYIIPPLFEQTKLTKIDGAVRQSSVLAPATYYCDERFNSPFHYKRVQLYVNTVKSVVKTFKCPDYGCKIISE